MKNGEISKRRSYLYEDMFTMNSQKIECLVITMDHLHKNIDQSIQDFSTNNRPKILIREGMFDWMRRYEQMVDEFVTGIFSK